MRRNTRPNILWCTTDQQRADTIRALGNTHINTPNLDFMAHQGAAFTRAYTQSPICTPSRASFMTGRYPMSHHVYRNGTDHFPPSETLVTRMLADAGYECGLIGKHHLSRSAGRIEVMPSDGYGFVRLSDDPYPVGHAYTEWLQRIHGVDSRELWHDLLEGAPPVYGPGIPLQYHPATWWAEEAIDFIENHRKGGPWLLNLNPVDPHPPFFPPEEFFRRYDPTLLPYPLFRQSDLQRQPRFRLIDQQGIDAVDPYAYAPEDEPDRSSLALDYVSNPWDIPPPHYDARAIKAAYYATIELIDDRLGRVIQALRDTGQEDNTIVVYTSDHGEMLGDHGLMYKGCRFFEGLTRVPFLVQWPGTVLSGLESSALVELVDIAPTLLEAAGIDIPYFVQGKPLLALLTGRSDSQYHKTHVISEYQDSLVLPNASHGSMYFDGKYKVCVYHGSGIGEIFDLEEDPGEFEDLWDEPEFRARRGELLEKHFDAMMGASWAGIERTGPS